ncbi:hypothetical protein CHUAL_001647 [Chamberlinius hualienensis]
MNLDQNPLHSIFELKNENCNGAQVNLKHQALDAGILVFNLNVRSLLNAKDILEAYLSTIQKQRTVMIITETWLYQAAKTPKGNKDVFYAFLESAMTNTSTNNHIIADFNLDLFQSAGNKFREVVEGQGFGLSITLPTRTTSTSTTCIDNILLPCHFSADGGTMDWGIADHLATHFVFASHTSSNL